jgi:hypothetical protein
MKKYLGFLIAVSVIFLMTVVFTFRISQKLGDYKVKKEQVAESLGIENRMGNAWEWVPYFNPGESKMEEKAELEQKADIYYSSAARDGWIMMAAILSFLVFVGRVYKNSEEYYRIMGMAFLAASCSFLYLGLNSPFMEIEAYLDDFSVAMDLSFISPELGVEGRVYALYQNKSVLDLISFLFMGGNFFVALLILIFSIVFPVLKLLTSFIVFIAPKARYSKGAVLTIEKIGKWSMADVFVSSVFLAYFSFANMNVGVKTGATTLIGLYFFVAFVVFSIFSGYYLKRVVKRNT